MHYRSLRHVQLLQLGMAVEVRNLCDRHGIPYFLIAGTLLGAVRHGGFIPWDDDLDIGMLRNGYESFLQIARKELPGRYRLQNWDSDREHPHPYSKMILNGTRYVESKAAGTRLPGGIFIDIFPFDNIPDHWPGRVRQHVATYIWKRLLLAKSGYAPWKRGDFFKKFLYRILKQCSRMMSYDRLHRRFLRQMTRYNDRPTDKIAAFGGAYGYRKESIRREWAENLQTMEFEKEPFTSIGKSHEYLAHLYGDYWTPPPEEERGNRHEIVEVDFGGY